MISCVSDESCRTEEHTLRQVNRITSDLECPIQLGTEDTTSLHH